MLTLPLRKGLQMWSNLEFDRQMARAERGYLEPPDEREFDEDAYWDEADRKAEERWFENLWKGDL